MFKRNAIIITLCLFIAACTTPLSELKKQELKAYEAKGLKVTEKSETTGRLLGFLPGGGSFYHGKIAMGFVSIIVFPTFLYLVYEPHNGYEDALKRNYRATKEHIRFLRTNDLVALEEELNSGQITEEEYSAKKSEIRKKYQAF